MTYDEESKIRARFSSIDLPYACVTLDGRAIARLQYMFWEVIQHTDQIGMRAVREAIWSMPNKTSAGDLRQEIANRYIALV